MNGKFFCNYQILRRAQDDTIVGGSFTRQCSVDNGDVLAKIFHHSFSKILSVICDKLSLPCTIIPLNMKTRSLSLTVSPEIRKVSAELITPDHPICVMTLAHGAGAGMNHEFMVSISKSLAEKNIAVLRFNFPFMEKQKRRPDTPAVAHKTIEAAIKKAHELFPSLPLFVSGKSFGGRMSSQYLATQSIADVKGIIFFGFPLHQAGKPSVERAEHLKDVVVPMLFFAGYQRYVGIH